MAVGEPGLHAFAMRSGDKVERLRSDRGQTEKPAEASGGTLGCYLGRFGGGASTRRTITSGTTGYHRRAGGAQNERTVSSMHMQVGISELLTSGQVLEGVATRQGAVAAELSGWHVRRGVC